MAADKLCSWSSFQQVKCFASPACILDRSQLELNISLSAAAAQRKPCEGRANSLIRVCFSSEAQRDTDLSSRTIWSSLKFLSFWCPSFFLFCASPLLALNFKTEWCAACIRKPQSGRSFVSIFIFLFFVWSVTHFSFASCSYLIRSVASVCHRETTFLKKSLSSFCFSVFPGFPSAPAGWCGEWSVQHCGILDAEQDSSFLPGVHKKPESFLEGRLRHQAIPRPSGETMIVGTRDGFWPFSL